jgi:hypothetical protein
MNDNVDVTTISNNINDDSAADLGEGAIRRDPLAIRSAAMVTTPSPLVGVGGGGTAKKIFTQGKKWAARIFGGLPSSTRLLSFDVDPRHEIASFDSSSGPVTVTLEPELEQIVLARGRSPVRQAREARRNPAQHAEFLALAALQHDGRLPGSFERGAENERLAGYMAWVMSLTDTVHPALRSAFRTVLRRGGESGRGRANAPTVIIAASIVGGMGSSTLLPARLAAIDAMDELGIDADAATIIEIIVLPEAFPKSPLRLANAAATILDYDAASTTGTLPGAGPDSNPREPDLIIVCGLTNEAGMTLDGDLDELTDILGLITVLLGMYPLKEISAAVLANVQRRRARRTASGAPMGWGSAGAAAYTFSGMEFADLLARRLVTLQAEGLLAESDAAGIDETVAAVFAANHALDVEALMEFLKLDADGQPRIGDLAEEFLDALRGNSGGASKKVANVQDVEKTAAERIPAALADGAYAATTIFEGVEAGMGVAVRSTLDRDGIGAASQLVERAILVIDELVARLEVDRAYLKPMVAKGESVRVELFARLKDLVDGGFWSRRQVDPMTTTYLIASAQAHTDSYLLGLTECAIAPASALRLHVNSLRSTVMALAGDVRRIGVECDADVARTLARRPRSLLDQTLHERGEPERLFAERLRTPWDALTDDVRRTLAAHAGPASGWLDMGREALRATLMTAARPMVTDVEKMTADDFLAWALIERGVDPAVFVRDVFVQASPLWRVEPSRLPEDASLTGTTFRLIGVPDAERSPLKGVDGVTVVSTGDPDHVFAVQIVVGLPADALWRWPAYKQAYDRVAAEGSIVLHPYPDLNNNGRAAWRRGGAPRDAKRREKGH